MRISDWSSDVCSSDLGAVARIYSAAALAWPAVTEFDGLVIDDAIDSDGIVTLTMEVTTDFLEGPLLTVEFTGGGGASGEEAMRGVLQPAGRSEERRVGNEGVSTCRSRW